MRPALHIGCRVEGCEKPHHSGGFCNSHYVAEKRGFRDEDEVDFVVLTGAESLFEPEEGARRSNGYVRIQTNVEPSDVLRCPDCGKRYGLQHGWGWHCRVCHRTWPAGCPCACGLTGDWQGGVYAGSQSAGRRARPPAALKKKILAEQRNRCFYCVYEFGTIFRRHNKPFPLKVEWDHFVPFSYSARNDTDNWVAACHICNRIKGCLVFNDSDHARTFVMERREQKGYELDEGERIFLERQTQGARA